MAFNIDGIISLDPAETFEFAGAECAGNAYDRLINYNEQIIGVLGGIFMRAYQQSLGWRMFGRDVIHLRRCRKICNFKVA